MEFDLEKVLKTMRQENDNRPIENIIDEIIKTNQDLLLDEMEDFAKYLKNKCD